MIQFLQSPFEPKDSCTNPTAYATKYPCTAGPHRQISPAPVQTQGQNLQMSIV
jgi:hypothetical protein